MRSLRKPILLLLAVAMLVSAVVYATVAFYTDAETVTNTFSIGNVDIKLDETDLDENCNPVINKDTGKPERTELGNNYHLIPGKTYVKDPTVTLKDGSEPAYIRMVVTISDFEDFSALFGTKPFETFFTGYDPEIWIPAGSSETVPDSNVMLYEFRYHEPVIGGLTLKPLFESFTLPGQLDRADLETLDNFKVVVQAHAIQVEGFSNNEDGAWKAFGAQMTGEGVIKPFIEHLPGNNG